MNILTSLLFLKRKTDKEIAREAVSAGQQPDYPVFMAVAEKVGIDRRGNTVYKRRPDGEVILEPHEEKRIIPVHGPRAGRSSCTRMVKAIDNDLPEIAKAYKAFRAKYPEPGLKR